MVELLVVRHAPAGDRESFGETGKDDALRPLTAEGRRKMKLGAAGLRTLVPDLAVLWTSPLVRAHQTAEILGEAYGARPVLLPALAPDGSAESCLAALRRAHGSGARVFVGHEPSLSMLVGWLLSAQARSLVELKKGAACLLEFGAPPSAGGATLRWLLQPSELRALGKS